MRVVDVIFSLMVGRFIAFLFSDFLGEWGIKLGIYYSLILWVAFPFISLFCLWIAYIIGRKFLFIFQAAKHFLVGAFATVIDLKIFVLSLWFFSLFLSLSPMILKGASFLISTSIKYWGNKYWAFGRHEKENIKEEIVHFFYITAVGLIIDIIVFYFLTRMLQPQFQLSAANWVKLSVIFAATAAALWNFLGYKFIVFKK